MQRLLGIGIISCLVGGLGILGAGAAQANCIRGEVVLYWSNQTDQTVWPESHCFHDTGEGDMTSQGVSVRENSLPTGYPAGGRVKVWIPWP